MKTSLDSLRSSIITSLFGRRAGLDQNGLLVGMPALRMPVDGFSSEGSTFPSTGTGTLSKYGVSVIGSSASSGTISASPTCQQLPAPVPGIPKYLFNPSTAVMTVGTTAAAAYFMTSGGSTYQYLTMSGKGQGAVLLGISTDVWAVMGGCAGSSFSTQIVLI